jgi:hypothetical protein
MAVEVVIIGGGIAGCYTAFRLLQKQPDLRVLIIEACNDMGGRTQSDTFEGVAVVKGAGVGRLKKDKLLQKLMRSLSFPVRAFPTGHRLAGCTPLPAFVQTEFLTLREGFQQTKPPFPMTFRDYATAHMSKRAYRRFVNTSGFSDYENEDAADVFALYSFEDNFRPWSAFAIPWSELIHALATGVPCLTNTRVTHVDITSTGSVVTCDNRTVVHCKHVVFATNSTALQTLLPAYAHVYKHIHGNPFLLIYGAFTASSARAMATAVCSQGCTVVPGSPLQKVIHMKDNVYMIAYCDNANALALRAHSSDNADNRLMLCAMLELAFGFNTGSLSLKAIKSYYWASGTHYCDPIHRPYKTRRQFLSQAQHPAPGVSVVGECVALHQGWAEGALETVENVLYGIIKS